MPFARWRCHTQHIICLLTLSLSWVVTFSPLAPARAAEDPAATVGALVRAGEGEVPTPRSEDAIRWRGKQTIALLPLDGAPAGVLLRAGAASATADTVRYRLCGEQGGEIAHGECAAGKECAVPLPVGQRCLLTLDAGGNTAAFTVRNACYGVYAGTDAPTWMNSRARRLYFLVPNGTRTFTLTGRAQNDAPARVQVFTPENRPAVAQGDSALQVTVPAGAAGKIWSLLVEGGVEEDVRLSLSADIPPYLADSPAALAVPFIHYTAAGALYLKQKEHPAVLEATLSVPPQTDRLVQAQMRRAGSRRAIWATRPAPYSTGSVRIVLPSSITTGSYDLETTLYDPYPSLKAHYVQRLVIAHGFAYLGSEQPLLKLLPLAGDAAPRLCLGLDPDNNPDLNVQVAFTREGERRPVSQQELKNLESTEMPLTAPLAATDGIYRIAATASIHGKTLASATLRASLHAGQLSTVIPPAAKPVQQVAAAPVKSVKKATSPARKTVLRRSQRRHGYVLFTRAYQDFFPYQYAPPRSDIGRPLSLWVTPGEYEPATFGVYAIRPLQGARVSVGTLRRVGGGGSIAPSAVTVRLVCFQPQHSGENNERFVPTLLEKAAAADIPTDHISQYWLTLHVPENTPAGDYRGVVTLQPQNARAAELKFLVKVLPYHLAQPAGRTWGLCAESDRWQNLSDAAIAAELHAIKTHGLDSLALAPLSFGTLHNEGGQFSVDFSRLSRLVRLYRGAGLHGPLLFDLQALSPALARLCGKPEQAFDEAQQRLYRIVLADLAMRAASESWPPIVYRVAPDTANGKIEQELLKAAGLTTITAVTDPAAEPAVGKNEARCYPAAAVLSSTTAAQALRRRLSDQRYWWNGSSEDFATRGQKDTLAASRYLSGFAFLRSGATGAWIGSLPNAQNSSAGEPALQWEGIREGIDDARYLYTFETLAARAKRSGDSRAAAYAAKVSRETTARLNHLPWGITGVNSYQAQEVRVWLAKYTGTLLNKLASSSSAPRRHHRHRHH